jgi:hypothetical protein
VTGRAFDSDGEDDSPGWCAPEESHRFASRPEPNRPLPRGVRQQLGWICTFLVEGKIEAEDFRFHIQLLQRYEKAGFPREDRA